MKHRFAVCFAFGTILALGSSPTPWAPECAVLDRIAAAGVSFSNAAAALDLLERVALGRHESVSDESAESVGARRGLLREKDFGEPYVRAHAMRKIGEVGTPAAEEFLAGLRLADVGVDPGQEVWPAAQIALRQARLARIADRQMQNDFLEGVLTEPHDATSNSKVVTWAVDELCDRGATAALSAVRKSIRHRMEDRDAESEIAFCEARIRVWYQDSDRTRSLSSVLDLNAGPQDIRLTRWAIHQLASMQSAEADRVLSRFAEDVGKLQPGSPDDLALWQCREEIRITLMGRAK